MYVLKLLTLKALEMSLCLQLLSKYILAQRAIIARYAKKYLDKSCRLRSTESYQSNNFIQSPFNFELNENLYDIQNDGKFEK